MLTVGLAACAGFNELPPKRQPNKITNAQIKNKKMKKEFQAGTETQQRTDAENSTSASVEANPMLGAVCQPETLAFIDWISDNKYFRLTRINGHTWFNTETHSPFSTLELWDLFMKEMENECLEVIAEEHDNQLQIEAGKLVCL